MKKYIVMAILAIGVGTTSFAQDVQTTTSTNQGPETKKKEEKAVKKEDKAQKKEYNGSHRKAIKKEEKAEKKVDKAEMKDEQHK